MKRTSVILKTFALLGILTFSLVASVSAQGLTVSRHHRPPGHLIPPVPLLPGSGSECVTPPSGLAGWWPGEGNANDLVGGNNGTVTEGTVTYAAAEVGQGFSFDGGSNRIVVPDAPALNFGSNQDLSIEAWISPLPPPPFLTTGVMSLVDKRYTPNSSICQGYEFGLVNGSLFFHMSDSIASGGVAWLSSGPDLRDGNLHHVAVTVVRNSTTGGHLYVDGVQVLEFDPTSVPGDLTTTEPFRIGNHAGSYYSYFKGRIDEVSLYNRALSALEIAAIYSAGSAGKCPPVPPAVPVISSFTPLSGTNGAVVTISGTNFSATAAENIVHFGAVQAAVLAASPMNLVVTVPAGATYAPVTVTVDGLTAYSRLPFLPTFNGNGGGSAPSLAPQLDLPAGDGPGMVVIADLDGDGKPDVVVNSGNHIMSVYQNTSTNGTMTAGSFAPRVDWFLGTGAENGMVAADLDGDGKLDIVLLDRDANQVIVLRNITTPGMITKNSFAAPVMFPVGADPRGVSVRDLDGDGKPEIAVANWGDSTVSILRNIGQPGNITPGSFAPAVVFATGTNPQTLAMADLDGDGQPDIVTANIGGGTDGSVSVLRNTSFPGTISLASHVVFAGLPTSFCVAIGDLDGDGKPDLAVSSFDGGQAVSVYRNTSTPGDITASSFASRVDFSTGGWGNAVAIGDLDGDGKPDLAVVTQLPDHLSIFKNISTPGSFTADSLAPRVDFPAGWNPNGVAIGDLDGDGRPDVACGVTYAATLSVYQNQTPFNGPPVITSQPGDQTTVQGSNVVLSVEVAGAGPFSYQWSFNGTNIFGATNATLTLANLHPYQSGCYAVTITTPSGSVTSSCATIAVIAQNILVYKYSGDEKITTAGQAICYGYSGQLFFIPDTTSGTFVGWATIKGKKQYWVNPLSGYLLVTIPGDNDRSFTVLGRAGQGIDTNGYPHLWSFLHKGQNSQLTIGAKKYFSFPDKFSCDATQVYPDLQTGNPVLGESSSVYIFMAQSTQAANNNGQTMADLVNALIGSLAGQGYQRR